MSVLGFSHIVTEVRDLTQTLAFYEDQGFVVNYTLQQEVPEAKHRILAGSPSRVKVHYLKHSSRPCIGIELIQHDVHFTPYGNKTICFGYSNKDEETWVWTDPDGNRIVRCRVDEGRFHQHIFVPTERFLETQSFYKQTFRLKEVEVDAEFQNIYRELFGVIKSSLALSVQPCLSSSWDACLHVVETDQIMHRHLNDYGFSCFCFLINEDEYTSFVKQGIKIVGPIRAKKQVEDNVSQFDVGFITDPNGYPIEFYVPGGLSQLAGV